MGLVNVCACVCVDYGLVFAAGAGEGIITYCVTLYPAAFCLIEEIEERPWRLWHYLLRLVTEASLIWSALALTDSHSRLLSRRCREMFAARVTNSFAYLIASPSPPSSAFRHIPTHDREQINRDTVRPLFVCHVFSFQLNTCQLLSSIHFQYERFYTA